MNLAAPVAGFLLPWKCSVTILSRTFSLSLFDLAAPFLLLLVIRRREQLFARGWACFTLPLLYSLILMIHIIAAQNLHATFTLYALWAGIALSTMNLDSLRIGLACGLAMSGLVALPLWIFAPHFVTDHLYFCAFAGSKNGLAFFAGMAVLLGLERNHKPPTYAIMAALAIMLLSGSRGGVIALTAGMIAILFRSGELRKMNLTIACIVAGAAAWLLATRDLPADRWEFASSIATHAAAIPWNGIGQGSGYGLDLFFKSWLETGLTGLLLLAAMIARSVLQNGLSPALAFVIVFGVAHDPLRWPLFWLCILSHARLSGHMTAKNIQ